MNVGKGSVSLHTQARQLVEYGGNRNRSYGLTVDLG